MPFKLSDVHSLLEMLPSSYPCTVSRIGSSEFWCVQGQNWNSLVEPHQDEAGTLMAVSLVGGGAHQLPATPEVFRIVATASKRHFWSSIFCAEQEDGLTVCSRTTVPGPPLMGMSMDSYGFFVDVIRRNAEAGREVGQQLVAAAGGSILDGADQKQWFKMITWKLTMT